MPRTPGSGTPQRRTARRGAPPRAGGRTPGRAGARPATGAGPQRKAAAARTARERRASRSLKRVLVLASILVLLAITLVPTLRSYLRQQGEIAALRDRVAAQRLTVEELQKEQARWKDNAYVEQQARERLKFVKVGDRSYTVIDGDPVEPTTPGVVSAPSSSDDHPWYGRLWESARLADARAASPQPAAPGPATTPAPAR